MPTTAPAIDTPRLSLRAHTLDDFAGSAAMWGDPDVVRHIGGRPFTEEECWGRLSRYVGQWALLGFGYWVVRETATGRFVGEVGLANMRRGLGLDFEDLPEAGWALATWSHGKGYASEAVEAILGWGESHFGSSGAWCLIDPVNAASIRVALKNGFTEQMQTTYHGNPTVIFRR